MGREVPVEAACSLAAETEGTRLAKPSAGTFPAPGSLNGHPTAVPSASIRGSSSMHATKLEVWHLSPAGETGAEPASDGDASNGAWGLNGGAQHAGSDGTASHRASDSMGGASDEASPSFLRMLSSTRPGHEGEGSGQDEAPLPATLAKLNALNGIGGSPPAGTAGAAGAAAADTEAAAGNGHAGKHKKSFMRLFRTGSGKHKLGGGQQTPSPPPMQGLAERPLSGGSEPGQGGKKKKSSWFSSGGKSSPKAAAVDTADSPGAAAAGQRSGGGSVMLPGLPLTVMGHGQQHNGSGHSLASSLSEAGSSVSRGADVQPGGASPAAPSLPVADVFAAAVSVPASAPAVLSLGPAFDADAAGVGKKGHRRHRSITSLLLNPGGWRKRSHTASLGSESEFGVDATPSNGASHDISRAGSLILRSSEAMTAAAAAGGYGACFGLASSPHSTADGETVVPYPIAEEPPPPLLPSGITGIRNIGNTCFVNAALQCLRYTPGLPLAVAPDLLELAEQAQRDRRGAGLSRTASGAVPPAVPAAAAAAGSDATVKQQQEQGQGQQQQGQGGQAEGEHGEGPPCEGPPLLDVHQLALARVSSDMSAVAQQVLSGAGSGSGRQVPSFAALDAQPGSSSAPGGDPGAAGVAPTEAASTTDAVPAEGAAAEGAVEAAAPAPAEPVTAVGKPQRPPRGALLEAFAQVVRELYVPPAGSGNAVCAAPLLRTLRAFPIAADYFDGGQHDCQEVLRVMMDLLHEDLNRVQRPSLQLEAPPADVAGDAEAASAQGGGADEQQGSAVAAQAAGASSSPGEQQQQQQPDEQASVSSSREQEAEGEQEAEEEEEEEDAVGEVGKADRMWRQQLERDSSLITDLFGGQLQSSVTCHKCGGRFTMYEPFWDLSLPLAKDGKGGGGLSWLGLKGTPASIQDCLTAFTADEKLEGAEAFHCERCHDKTAATKHLRVHRFPEVLVLQIKRFKYKGASTDKLTASVSFPLKELRLQQYASPECAAAADECCYELYGVSNHYGNLSGGHYTAMCRVPQREGSEAWYSFNDEQVTRINESQVVSQYAYILFYVRSRKASVAAAAAEASRGHRRSASAASASAGGA